MNILMFKILANSLKDEIPIMMDYLLVHLIGIEKYSKKVLTILKNGKTF